jgi:DNA polymerase III subunit gamma/tau
VEADAPRKPDIWEEKPFTIEQLSVVWKTYGEKLKNEEKASEMSVINQPYELKNDGRIVIKLANSIQDDILERFKTGFVRYLRQELANQKISIATEIVQEVVQQRLYTAQDKFNYMVEKNPKLLEFRRRLDLDYDY